MNYRYLACLIVLSAAAVILTGCATPAHTSIHDDPEAYSGYSSGAYSSSEYYRSGGGAYSYSVYYPWWSVDYFYLGYSSGYPYYPGWSFGYRYGRPAWHYPYYRSAFYPYHFSALYPPIWYYPSYWGGYRYGAGYGYGYHRGYGGGYHGSGTAGNPGSRDVVVGSQGGVGTTGEYRPGLERGIDRRDRMSGRGSDRFRDPSGSEVPVRRSITAPSASGAESGMVVISRSDGKIGPSRLEPVKRGLFSADVKPSQPFSAGSAPTPDQAAPAAGPRGGFRPQQPMPAQTPPMSPPPMTAPRSMPPPQTSVPRSRPNPGMRGNRSSGRPPRSADDSGN